MVYFWKHVIFHWLCELDERMGVHATDAHFIGLADCLVPFLRSANRDTLRLIPSEISFESRKKHPLTTVSFPSFLLSAAFSGKFWQVDDLRLLLLGDPTGNRQLLGLFQMLNEQARVWEKLFKTLREFRKFVLITQPFRIASKSNETALNCACAPKCRECRGWQKLPWSMWQGDQQKFTVSQCK